MSNDLLSRPGQDLVLLVGQMDGKLDILLETNGELAKRVGRLESALNRVHGAAAVISIASAWFGRDHLLPLLGLGGHQ